MRILLFALTGFGNKVLDALLEESCDIEAVFTQKEQGPFPYYPERNLSGYARERKIKVYEEFDWGEVKKVIKNVSPDLLFVATFHKIIPKEIIFLVPLCVNIHPSLLPKYRGPTPVEWALFKGEKEAGVTAHLLTEKVDEGDILIQKKILIKENKSLADISFKEIFSEDELKEHEVINLKEAKEFIGQYVELRNKYFKELLTHKVTIPGTLKWMNEADVELYGIIKKGILLGVVLVYIDKRGEIAFFAREPGKGYGSKLLKIADKVGLEQRGLPFLWAWTRKENFAAIKALERSGYIRQGIITKEYEGDMVDGYVLKKYGARLGILRKKLAELAGEVVRELIDQIKTKTLRSRPQSEREATYFPKFNNLK